MRRQVHARVRPRDVLTLRRFTENLFFTPHFLLHVTVSLFDDCMDFSAICRSLRTVSEMALRPSEGKPLTLATNTLISLTLTYFASCHDDLEKGLYSDECKCEEVVVDGVASYQVLLANVNDEDSFLVRRQQSLSSRH